MMNVGYNSSCKYISNALLYVLYTRNQAENERILKNCINEIYTYYVFPKFLPYYHKICIWCKKHIEIIIRKFY